MAKVRGATTGKRNALVRPEVARGAKSILVGTIEYSVHTDLLNELHTLGARIGHVAGTSRKLVQLSLVLSALTTAAQYDHEPRALDGAAAWATRYLDKVAPKRGAHEIRARPRTLQQHARVMRNGLRDMSVTRSQAAKWLAHQVDTALGLYLKVASTLGAMAQHRAALEAAVLKRMPKREGGAPEETFCEDVELTIVVAFKVGGLSKERADQLFKGRR